MTNKIGDVDEADTDTLLLEECRGRDGLKRDLDTAADEDDVWVYAIVGREPLPNRGSRDAVSLSLLGGEPGRGGVLGADL